jgi:hypothetical protein
MRRVKIKPEQTIDVSAITALIAAPMPISSNSWTRRNP